MTTTTKTAGDLKAGDVIVSRIGALIPHAGDRYVVERVIRNRAEPSIVDVSLRFGGQFWKPSALVNATVEVEAA